MTSEPDNQDWRSCPDCAAPYVARPLAPGEKLQCRRCGARLAVYRRGGSLQAELALTMTGLVLLVLANVTPVMTFSVAGSSQSNLIITGIHGLVQQGYAPLALLVFFCGIAAPALYLGLTCYGLIAGGLQRPLPGLKKVAHLAERVAPWSLVPVFGVACGVAAVRLELLGHVTWESGAWFVLLLSLCCLALAQLLDRERIEALLQEVKS